MKMAIKAKLPSVFFLFSLVLVFANLALAKEDPELKWCKQLCRQQRQYDEQQKEQCQQGCEAYYREKQRREHEGGGGRGHEDEWNPESPEQRQRECTRRCDRREEREQPQCQQQCQQRYEREKQEQGRRGRGEGEGNDSYEGGERERERAEEQQEGRNPYVFEDQHFTTRAGAQHGRLRVLQKFTERSKLLRGIENYRLAILEADPQTFILPHHCDAEGLFFVARGRGTISFVRQDRRESFNIRCGDVLRIPAGTTVYLINRDNSEKLVIAKLIHPVSVPGQFEEFYGPGGENPESFYRAFSTEVLESALNTKRDRLQKLFGQQRQGFIVKASEEQIRALSHHEEGGIWPFGGESRGPFNLFNKQPSQSNQYGQLREVNARDYRELEDLDVAVSFANITQGSMTAPVYSSRATKISIVTDGEGYFEMACPHLSSSESGGSEGPQGQRKSSPSYRRVSGHLRRGTVVVVPAGHPIVAVASNNQNLQLVCFEINARNNEKFPLAGRRNVINQLEREAKELAFAVPAREVEEVFRNQKEEFFFRGPRQQHEGRADA
ncbi:hypothetical protein F0562_002522 [Nyssa sinensis]|uniref:Cupin type-1 domain-containing protein n=1 Tax=Nyssa sinensis TaxID=561372 RepID=A0A5J5C685_9ASTE|nr:hypothetical protein F0562_002522 [Nyssa sinensis]